MYTSVMHAARRAFSRSDLSATVVAVIVLASIVFGQGRHFQRQFSREAVCMNNMMEVFRATAGYAADNRGVLPTFTWNARSGVARSQDPLSARDDLTAVQRQAVQMLRMMTDTQEIDCSPDWLPQVQHSWLVLWWGRYSLHNEFSVCPEDGDLLRLRREFLPQSGNIERDPWVSRCLPPRKVWDRTLRAYSSSYQFVPHAWSSQGRDSRWQVEQGNTDEEYRVPKADPFGRGAGNLDDGAFNENKVLLYDTYDRHVAPQPLFYGDPRARQPLASFDAAVRIRKTGDANQSANPNDGSQHIRFRLATSIPGQSSDPGREYDGYYRWTWGGLRGDDFGKEEFRRPTKSPFNLDPVEWITARPFCKTR